MNRSFVAAVCAAATAVALISPPSASADSAPPRREVVSLRYWTAPDHTRIVLDMSSECAYMVSERSSPDRIVIDIPRGALSEGLGKIDVGDGVVDRIRVNALSSGAQVVIDLSARAEFQHFALKPNNIHPRHRIVIDVTRTMTVTEKKMRSEKAREVAESGDYIVIIDPGHGGSQPGAPSRYGPSEKYYTLPLSKMIAEEIERHEGFKAVLTRNGDYDVGLYKRIEIARNHGGHCFISVHLNGNEKRKLRGSEVYYLSLDGASDQHAAAVAEKENMQFGEDVDQGGLGSDVEDILFELRRNDAMRESAALAEKIAGELSGVEPVPFRGIRQNPYLVLRGIQMPSVLVEAAYLSNKSDVAQIKQKSVQRKVAMAVASGVVSYLLENPPESIGRKPVRLAYHTVSRGETLSGIAKRYSCSVSDIKILNKLGSSSLIRPGQRLMVYDKK